MTTYQVRPDRAVLISTPGWVAVIPNMDYIIVHAANDYLTRNPHIHPDAYWNSGCPTSKDPQP